MLMIFHWHIPPKTLLQSTYEPKGTFFSPKYSQSTAAGPRFGELTSVFARGSAHRANF